MEHARTGPSTGSSPLVARTTLPSCTCLLHCTLHFLACRSASIATVPVRVARALVRRSRRAHLEELSHRFVCRYPLPLCLLLVDLTGRVAAVPRGARAPGVDFVSMRRVVLGHHGRDVAQRYRPDALLQAASPPLR